MREIFSFWYLEFVFCGILFRDWLFLFSSLFGVVCASKFLMWITLSKGGVSLREVFVDEICMLSSRVRAAFVNISLRFFWWDIAICLLSKSSTSFNVVLYMCLISDLCRLYGWYGQCRYRVLVVSFALLFIGKSRLEGALNSSRVSASMLCPLVGFAKRPSNQVCFNSVQHQSKWE